MRKALPTLLGIDFLPDTLTVATVLNASLQSGGPTSSGSQSQTTYQYCNITVAYTHTGKEDRVNVHYAFPAPSDYKRRFYNAGGGGFTLNRESTGGLPYGAVSGATDGGYNGFSQSFDEAFLLGNGSINWDATYMFSHQALGELTMAGKAIARVLYDLPEASKIFTYFEGCSDGGREAMSQAQQWGDEYDGVIAGAPAFRFAQQQVLHLFPAVVEQTHNYYPPPCELAHIVNATIKACDPFDGRTDGVVSRTDLCSLRFNLSSIIGETYHCTATTATGGQGSGPGPTRRQAPGSGSSSPEQNGTVTAEGVAIAQAIYAGLHNSIGQRGYLSWQIASELSDASTSYNSTTDKWSLSIPSMGGEYVAKFIQRLNLTNLANLDNVTYDTLVDWMNIGMIRYQDNLQTTLPDLSVFQSTGGKLLHYHGESDPSIPAASSVHYWEAVANIMDGGRLGNRQQNLQSLPPLSSWYQLYMVPGAGHCGTNNLQPGPYPQDNMQVMIDWVENDKEPSHLNATVSTGTYKGETQMLCQWPTRPLWQGRDNSSAFDCVIDPKSIDSWTYSFPAFKLPVW